MTAAIAALTDVRGAVIVVAWVAVPALLLMLRSKRNPKR